ncbi:MAG: hypothetical protein WBZ14_02075 [Terriglobales bacterium]|jgi:hypothetical protein
MILIAVGVIGGWSHFIGVVAPLGRFFADKLFDVVLAFAGTIFGYWLAKRHLEHFVNSIVERMDAKYLDLNCQIAFHKAVGAMLPELPNFYVRPAAGFSSDVATAVAEFTRWSAALDPTHTPEKSMELVGKEAHILAAGLIAKDIGFREEAPTPNYEWTVMVGGLPAGWEVQEVPDLSIYNWGTGNPVHQHALMEETERTATSIKYSWKWSMKDTPSGVYVGVVNYQIGGNLVTGSIVGERLKVFFKRENGTMVKAHENIPWD